MDRIALDHVGLAAQVGCVHPLGLVLNAWPVLLGWSVLCKPVAVAARGSVGTASCRSSRAQVQRPVVQLCAIASRVGRLAACAFDAPPFEHKLALNVAMLFDEAGATLDLSGFGAHLALD